ncbi:hypothetical protein B484DRAFT_337239, partial [Ochromonadaceae sp. CCMP2298]
LILLYLCLASWEEGGLFQTWGIGGLSYGQITTTIYLKVSVSDFLTLFSARTGENWFWTTPPAMILLGAGGVALACSTALALGWPDTQPDGVPTIGLARKDPRELAVYIWLYCLVWWIVQDAAKVGIY